MSLIQHLPVLPVIVPLLTAPLVVMLQPRGLAWAATSAAAALTFVLAINLTFVTLAGVDVRYEMGGWPEPFGIALAIDAFSALVLLVVTGAATFAALAGRQSIDSQIEQHRQPLYYAAFLLALAGLVGMVVAADVFNIFVFMEISSLATYVLIAGGPDRRALPAVFKYLIMGTIGATFYLIGVGLIYMMTGTLNLDDMADLVREVADQKPILVAAGFITIGLALKAALFPLHVWLPNAYTHAPHMVTVFLAACGTKVAVYVLLRFDFVVFQANLEGHAWQFSLFLMPLAVLGIIVASAVAMFEGHIKRLLAFSSVAQIGYILLGVSLLTHAGITAASIHIFNHALAKGALFLAVAALAYRYADLRVDQLAGAAKSMPLTAAALVGGGLSLIGVPGTAGFISKWLLISALLDHGVLGYALVVVVIVGSLMSIVYVWRIVEAIYFKAPVADSASISEAPAPLVLAAWIAVALNVGFGLLPTLPATLARLAANILTGVVP